MLVHDGMTASSSVSHIASTMTLSKGNNVDWCPPELSSETGILAQEGFAHRSCRMLAASVSSEIINPPARILTIQKDRDAFAISVFTASSTGDISDLRMRGTTIRDHDILALG